jgi:hypothetical protein
MLGTARTRRPRRSGSRSSGRGLLAAEGWGSLATQASRAAGPRGAPKRAATGLRRRTASATRSRPTDLARMASRGADPTRPHHAPLALRCPLSVGRRHGPRVGRGSPARPERAPLPHLRSGAQHPRAASGLRGQAVLPLRRSTDEPWCSTSCHCEASSAIHVTFGAGR